MSQETNTEMMDALLYFRTEAIKQKLSADIDEQCNAFIRPPPTLGMVDDLVAKELLEISQDYQISLTAAGTDTLANMFPIPTEGDSHIKLPTTATKPSYDLSLKMYIRFLEVIQLDLDALLIHINDSMFFKHNAPMTQGFILNLRLSYSDQDCDGFLQILSDLQNEFPCLYKKDSDKAALLTSMKTRIRDLLEVLTDRAETGHA